MRVRCIVPAALTKRRVLAFGRSAPAHAAGLSDVVKYAADGTRRWIVRMNPVQDDGFGLATDNQAN